MLIVCQVMHFRQYKFYLWCLSFTLFISYSYLTQFERNVAKVADALYNFHRVSTGVQQLQQRYDGITKEVNLPNKGSTTLDDVVRHLGGKVLLAKNGLSKLRDYFQSDYTDNPQGDNREVNDCCNYKGKLLWNNFFQTYLNLQDYCEFVYRNTSYCINNEAAQSSYHLMNSNNVRTKLKEVFSELNFNSPYLMFGGTDGYFIQFPASKAGSKSSCECLNFEPRIRPWYVNAMVPVEGRDVIIAVDFSQNMRSRVKELRYVVNVLLDSLDEKDRVLLRLYRDGRKIGPLECMKEFTEAAPPFISKLREFFTTQNVVATHSTISYVNVITDSYEAFISNNRKKVIFFVTSGFMQDSSATIMQTIEDKSKAQNCSVHLNFLIISDGDMTSSTQPNHENYLKSACKCGWCASSASSVTNNLKIFEIQTGRVDKRTIRRELAPIFSVLASDATNTDIYYSLPYIDFSGQGNLIDACSRVHKKNTQVILGITCISFLSETLLGVTTEQSTDFYVFIIDKYGKTFIHPKYAEPVLEADPSNPTNILTLETSDEFKQIYQLMKSGQDGSKTFTRKTSVPKGGGRAEFKEYTYKYQWKKVPNSPFIACVVESTNVTRFTLDTSNITPNSSEMYHRLDLYENSTELCLMKEKLAIASSSILKLPRDAFRKPLSFFEDETLSSITKLADFLAKETDVVPDELKSPDTAFSIRHSVVASNFLVEDIWKKDDSLQSLYIMWRYFASEEGVIRVFPGTQLHTYYDPRARPWYIQAKTSPNVMTLTAPYEDAFTGTMCVSLLKTVFQDDKNGGKKVAGISGLDFTVPYFQSILLQNAEVCNTVRSGEHCIVIDQSGYLIYHEDFLPLKKYGEMHLIEKEPIISNDMLKQGLMTKTYCVGYFSTKHVFSAAHVYYFYTLSITATISRESLDGCLKYIITPVRGTNIFVIRVIKNTCDTSSPPCTCNLDSSKSCKDSHPNDLKICECPCYNHKVCLSELPKTRPILICSPPSRELSINVTCARNCVPEINKAALKNCFDPKCYKSKSVLECDRIGCEWCYSLPNGTHVPDSEKVCNNTGDCFRELQPPTTMVTTTKNTTIITPKPSTGDDLSGGAIAGIVIGVLAFILIVVGLAYYFMRIRKKPVPPKQSNQPKPPSPVIIANPRVPDVVQESDWF